jgi:hypothetical protein
MVATAGLTVDAPVSAVPEPSIIALMAGGVALVVGVASRARRVH